MTEFTEGQRVLHEDREGEFVRVGDPDEAIEVEIGGAKIPRDAAWVRFDDGELEAVPYYQLRPA